VSDVGAGLPALMSGLPYTIETVKVFLDFQT